MRHLPEQALALVCAVVATGAVASMVQTQFNLATLADLGAAVDAATRTRLTLEDLARFGPVMTALAAAGLLPAFLVGHFLTRAAGAPLRPLLLALAGCVGMWAMFTLLAMVSPMPALVVATATLAGLAAMCLTGGVGGLVYAAMSTPEPSASARRELA